MTPVVVSVWLLIFAPFDTFTAESAAFVHGDFADRASCMNAKRILDQAQYHATSCIKVNKVIGATVKK